MHAHLCLLNMSRTSRGGTASKSGGARQGGVDVDAVLQRMQDNLADATVLVDCCKLLRGHLSDKAFPSRLAEADSPKIMRVVMNAMKVHIAHETFQVTRAVTIS